MKFLPVLGTSTIHKIWFKQTLLFEFIVSNFGKNKIYGSKSVSFSWEKGHEMDGGKELLLFTLSFFNNEL